jgi:hypothetical protein
MPAAASAHHLRHVQHRMQQHIGPGTAHSGLISSASLCDSPSTQGHMIITVGATRLIQQASCPAPETMFIWP